MRVQGPASVQTGSRPRRGLWVLAFVVLAGLPAPRSSAAVSAKAVEEWAGDFLARREAHGFGRKLSLPEGLRVQREFVKLLQPEFGRPVGYKVGLITREAQQKFGVEAPVRGVLLEKMLLANGSEVPRNYGVHPILEADLIVIVKDKEINKAHSILEVAENLKEVVAFIELPDAFIPTNPPPDGALLTAGNVGARLGIMGQRIPVNGTAAFSQALGDMTAVITDEHGTELGRGQGKAILDHPLNSVLWLIEELHQTGQKLKPGDILSLGAIKAIPLPDTKVVTVRYDGLPGGPLSVAVRLR